MAHAVHPTWQTASFAKSDRYDAWRHKLSDTFGSWNVDRQTQPDFDAEIAQYTQLSMQVANCVCDPCGGVSNRARAAHDGPEMLVVQVVVSGREHFTIDGSTLVLGRGDVAIWNTTRAMSFEVVERLEKTAVMVPLARLRSWLPYSWHSIATTLPKGSPGARLLISLIRQMAPDFLSGNLRHGEALTEALLGSVVSALDGDRASVTSCTLREAHFLLVKSYIERHLDDPALSPRMIAQANRISQRYLHCLFEPEGTTVQQYVIKQRLLRCRDDLSNREMVRRTITDIAFSRGFQSSTHFSLRFRNEFGVSPKEYRRQMGLPRSPTSDGYPVDAVA